jgi:hypothetical protein
MPKYKRRISIWFGTTIELFGVLLGFLILFLTGMLQSFVLSLVLLLVTWFCFWFFSHCLAHFVVGKLLGVNFLFYFVGKSSIIKLNLPFVSLLARSFPVLGIKVDDKSFLEVSSLKRALMFVSGAVASMTLPLICVIYALLYLPVWIAIVVGVITALNAVLTLFFSFKVGDLAKARKTLQRD